MGFTSWARLLLRLSHSGSSSVSPMALLGLQLTDGRVWDFSASIIAYANSSEYISIPVCLSICTLISVYLLIDISPSCWYCSLKSPDLCCCCCLVASVMSDSVGPNGLQPTRLLCPWDSPGKNTAVGWLNHTLTRLTRYGYFLYQHNLCLGKTSKMT